jgi:uracil DNA glycosylase
MMINSVLTDWSNVLNDLYDKHKLSIEQAIDNKDVEVYPARQLVFAAFNSFAVCDLKVVIIGQDVCFFIKLV